MTSVSHTYRSADKSLADQEGNKLQRQKILMFIYSIYYHNWRNISTIYIYMYKGKGLPRQAEVAQGVPGRLRPRILLPGRDADPSPPFSAEV